MDADTRVEVIRRRQQYEEHPEEFLQRWTGNEQELRDRIVRAQKLLPTVTISDVMLHIIAQICIDMAVDGHRADITMMKTASTIAAYQGRAEVIEEDVREAATLVLSSPDAEEAILRAADGCAESGPLDPENPARSPSSSCPSPFPLSSGEFMMHHFDDIYPFFSHRRPGTDEKSPASQRHQSPDRRGTYQG